ncbi:putative drug exporter of the RND superfamily [Amycolatopsis xylanica]|uniref:Putative drug exporter of the RND superfamily n=1 Tax=Amycolatopsis xylanica TaxID=589385 RepID=A0A1H3PH84_9PSEU|nr:MMPL family transporter [Amycolatopsis xylanica]SDZ00348.1 putative drug exporter of the RND superfamily [Amycolatopsis xylanica]
MKEFTKRKSKNVLYAAIAILFVTLGVGIGVVPHLSGGGFDASDTESARTTEKLEKEFKVGESDAVFLLTAKTGTVDGPEAAADGSSIAGDLKREPMVKSVVSYWEAKQLGGLRSNDGASAIVIVQLDGSQNDKSEWLRSMHERYDAHQGAVGVRIGGNAEVFRAIQDQIMADLLLAEAIAVPISMLLLLFVFRSVMAALLPIAMGALSACVTLAVLRLLTTFTEVSIFSLNLTSALALGLGIDYALLIVTRYREELALGRTVDDAVKRTMKTAGRTVLFSGMTVALSLGTLLLFPLPFLRSFGFAAVPVVFVAMLGALLVLPAMLKLLGHKVEKGSLHRLPSINPSERSWERLSQWTIRHKAPVALAGVIGLALLAIPFFHVSIGKSDDRVLPQDASVRAVGQEIRGNFPGNTAFPVNVYLPELGKAPADQQALNELSVKISGLPEIGLVRGGEGIYEKGKLVQPMPGVAAVMSTEHSSFLSVLLRPDIEVYSTEAADAITKIRELGGAQHAMVGGESARLVDNKDVIGQRLPIAIGLIILFTLILVFLLTGSVVVPIKALVLNLLSLTATFGVMVWGFQDGNLAGLLGFTSSGYLDNAMPVLMFCAAFGLSMDYELFLVARIREEYLKSGDNNTAVVEGIKKTGAVFTSAALLLAVVFAGLIASKVSIIQMAGLGIVLAILLDATLIRSILVPSLMSLMGKANWWAPGFLRKVHNRFQLSEGPAAGEPDQAPKVRDAVNH